jgi:ADP-ribose pyrophosphatase
VSLDALFDRGKEIYRGYVDDPRNTDTAWMETTAFHFHCSDAVARRLPLRAGDDASDVRP